MARLHRCCSDTACHIVMSGINIWAWPLCHALQQGRRQGSSLDKDMALRRVSNQCWSTPSFLPASRMLGGCTCRSVPLAPALLSRRPYVIALHCKCKCPPGVARVLSCASCSVSVIMPNRREFTMAASRSRASSQIGVAGGGASMADMPTVGARARDLTRSARASSHRRRC